MKKYAFYITVSLQALFLIGMASAFYLMDAFGEEIKLQTIPIDPQDPFYGDYLILDYEVERITRSEWDIDEELSYGDPIYLTLEKNANDIYQIKEVNQIKPKNKKNEVVLLAKYEWFDTFDNKYHVDLGLGRYYIEDNTGEMYEESGELLVTIVIAPWGQKKIVTIE
ncbi:GDYXXLXY domain-containing protein [Gracilibacillus marinus]|uniref:GDYXXLXY domain-containing protein n=1 Tax=Gracilibacillus marinus TaxID=630535 RepID=A0ABV8VQV0_9BACI